METTAPNKKLRHAAVRAVSAVLLALALLAVTGFSFIKLMLGPDFITSFDNVSEGDYVSANISLIIDFYAEGYSHAGGDATSLYAVSAGDEDFYTIVVPKRYFDSANTINQDTLSYMLGTRSSLSRFFTVTGTVHVLSDSELSYLYQWFSDNMQWLQSTDVIGEVSDYSDYLSVYALRVDYVGRLPAVWVYVLSSIAWLLLVYAVIILIRFALGKYSPAPAELTAPDAPAASGQPEPESSGAGEASTNENEVNDSDGS